MATLADIWLAGYNVEPNQLLRTPPATDLHLLQPSPGGARALHLLHIPPSRTLTEKASLLQTLDSPGLCRALLVA